MVEKIEKFCSQPFYKAIDESVSPEAIQRQSIKEQIEKGKIKIKNILKELKIDPEYIDNTGYTKMIWKLKNEKKR